MIALSFLTSSVRVTKSVFNITLLFANVISISTFCYKGRIFHCRICMCYWQDDTELFDFHLHSNYNQVQNILEQSRFTPSPNSNVVFALNWPANIDHLGSGGPLVGSIDKNKLCSKYFAFDCRHLANEPRFSSYCVGCTTIKDRSIPWFR